GPLAAHPEGRRQPKSHDQARGHDRRTLRRRAAERRLRDGRGPEARRLPPARGADPAEARHPGRWLHQVRRAEPRHADPQGRRQEDADEGRPQGRHEQPQGQRGPGAETRRRPDRPGATLLTLAQYVFFACLFLVGYTYLLYPCTLFVIYAVAQARADLGYLTTRRERRRRALRDVDLPPVTLIVPAYNEDAHLKDKIANVQELDYPRDRLQVVFVSDCSTDRTNEILEAVDDPVIETLLLPERSGKATALNRAVEVARHGILVFSDASTLFM